MFDLFLSLPSYLRPGAAIPHGRRHTGPLIAGLHLCRFIPDTVPSSSALPDPSSSQTHHLPLLHPGATLRRTLRYKVEDHVEDYWWVLLKFLSLCVYVCVLLTVLDQLVKYQLVTHGPMLHSSLPSGRARELQSLSFTMLPWSLTQRTLLVLLPTPQSTEHCEKQGWV